MLISCAISTEKDDEKETKQPEKSVQSDTADTDDELIPINPDDCDNIDQALSSKLKKALSDYLYEHDANANKSDPAKIPITFYEKIENCHIFRVSELMADKIHYRVIAGYIIKYGGIQTYYVYKDGNICTVAEAYEQGLLSKDGVYQFAVASGGEIVEAKE